MRTRLSILSVAILCFGVAPAMGDVFPDGADASQLQAALDGLTVTPVTGSSVNVATDMLPDGSDSFWSIVNSTTGSATMIIELAGFADTNKFGVYEPGDLTNKVEMFSGARVPGDKAVVGFIAGDFVRVNVFDKDMNWLGQQTSSQPFSGNVFGFYLDSSAQTGGGVFYSDTAANTDDQDHMYAYQGVGDTLLLPGQVNPSSWTNSGWVLAWEDLVGPLAPLGDPYGGTTGLSDRNFTDMVVMVESINPVPVPAAVLLGFLGLGAAGLKLRRFA